MKEGLWGNLGLDYKPRKDNCLTCKNLYNTGRKDNLFRCKKNVFIRIDGYGEGILKYAICPKFQAGESY